MPDNLTLLGDFTENNSHKNLQVCWRAWKTAKDKRDAVAQIQSCVHLVETLARETRIWLFSKLTDAREPPRNLPAPSAKSAFGREVEFLDRLRDNEYMRDLAASAPDLSLGFARLERVYELVKTYDEASDPTAARFQLAFDALGKDKQTWLRMMHGFVPFRNLASHPTNQLDSDGAPVVVINSLELLAPWIAHAMAEQVPWIMLQAAAHFGMYRSRSKDEVIRDNHPTVYALCIKKGLESSKARNWYARYDDDHNLKELFARLETDFQVRNAVAPDDGAESVLFNSAVAGCLLPIIGPAFGLPDLPESPGAAEVLQRTREVLSDERYQTATPLLLSVVSDRLNLNDIPDLASASPKPCDDPRAELVGEFALLAAQATMAFGTALATSGLPLTEQSLDASVASDLSKRITLASEAVHNLSRTLREVDRTLLGTFAIEHTLRVLNNDEVREHRLSEVSVRWLGDLVWHSLRWDMPIYPDAEALDLQLLLGTQRSENRHTTTRRRTPASGGAALLIEPSKLIEYLEVWSRRTDARMGAALMQAKNKGWRRDPFELLADAMVRCLKERRKGFVDSRFELKRNVFVVDATFHQRMVTALEATQEPGAVVYPIDIVDADDRKYPAWAMRRFPTPANAAHEYSILWHECGRSIDWQDVPRIIVIKPFGAPLERPDAEHPDQLDEPLQRSQVDLKNLAFPVPEDCRDAIMIKKRYLFDDVSILRDMVRRQDSMPPGFRNTIHNLRERKPFELFFLGYDLDEYGRRARIVADMRPANDDGVDKASRLKPRYVSQPPPSELSLHYLRRAGFCEYADESLVDAMNALASKLQETREGVTL